MGLIGKQGSLLLVLVFLLLSATAAKATGFLTLESSPTGAEVWYTGPADPDKKYLGDTPLENREVATGRYNIWLILPSHDTLAIPDVAIVEGQVTQLNREIPTHYGYLEVATDPDSADIWLDGVRIGPSPYVNNLVLPGVSRLMVAPRESHFKNSMRTLSLGKGDSTRLFVPAPYRDKSFLQENLSLPPWRAQLEAGLQFRSFSGIYSDSSKLIKLPTDKIQKQWDYPIGLRLGLPQGFEGHLLLPFKSHDSTQAPFPSNMRLGVKYTYRPLNVGFDLTYGLGFKNSHDALRHDFLGLTLLGMASKDKILGQAQAGFEFHFPDKADHTMDPGDVGFVHVQAGYLLDPVLPYLGITGRVHLDGDKNGVSDKSNGYVLIPEPGLIVDIADMLSLQFGVPFTVVGKSDQSYWGIHFSLSYGFGLK